MEYFEVSIVLVGFKTGMDQISADCLIFALMCKHGGEEGRKCVMKGKVQ